MMHVVLGDGEMTRRELSKSLEDLRDQAGETNFWFLVRGSAEPTGTEQMLMGWLNDAQIYYEMVCDDRKAVDKIYAGAQNTYEVKRLAPKVLSLMQELPEEGEEADLLALFVSNDDDAEEDRWLDDVCRTVAGGGFKVLALNDGLAEIDFEETEGEEAAEEEAAVEPEPEPAAKKKAPAKKAAALAAVPEPNGEYTRSQLEDMNLEQLKALAAERGITLPLRTKGATYVNHLLGEVTPTAEIEPVEVPEVSEELLEDAAALGEDAAMVLIDEVTTLNGQDIQIIASALVDAFLKELTTRLSR